MKNITHALMDHGGEAWIEMGQQLQGAQGLDLLFHQVRMRVIVCPLLF